MRSDRPHGPGRRRSAAGGLRGPGDGPRSGLASCARTWPRTCRSSCCPSAFVDSHALPITENGKLDRARPARAAARSGPNWPRRSASRHGAREACLRGLRGGARYRPGGRDDNFFELGGNSLRSHACCRCSKAPARASWRRTTSSRDPTPRALAHRDGRAEGCRGRARRPALSTSQQRSMRWNPSPSSAWPAASRARPTSSSSGTTSAPAANRSRFFDDADARPVAWRRAARRSRLRAGPRRDRRHRDVRRRLLRHQPEGSGGHGPAAAHLPRALLGVPGARRLRARRLRRARSACSPACTTTATSSATCCAGPT